MLNIDAHLLIVVILILALIVIILTVVVAIWQHFQYKAAEPHYECCQKEGSIEIRLYSPLIIAEIKVNGDRESAIKQGFKFLADYIFGNNEQGRYIAMTAPVMQERLALEKATLITERTNESVWLVRFVMPAGFNLATLPKPGNNAIHFVQRSSIKVVVIRFRGMSTKPNLNNHLQKLCAYIDNKDLPIVGNPIYAFYNPPWVLPFIRRNEIMFVLKEGKNERADCVNV